MKETQLKWLEGPPEWDDTMFDGWGGFKGETDKITIICDQEYSHIIPWQDREYILYSHKLYCKESRGITTETD